MLGWPSALLADPAVTARKTQASAPACTPPPALVKAAETMPWPDMLTVIREDNGFRDCKGPLPPAAGAARWAAFDLETDRLYAVMNECKEPDLD